MSDSGERLSTTVRDVEAEKFITAYAAHMKRSNKVTPPEWQDMVKTATWKEKGPLKTDWYYTRAAAVARKIYLRPRGIGQLQQAFGGRSRRGTRRNKSAKGTQGIIRHCLQQLEKAGIVQKHDNGGRKITFKGQKDMDLIAVQAKYDN